MRTSSARHVSTAVLLAALGAAGSARADWTEIGPAPFGNGDSGRTISIAPHPTDASIFYVGAATGGVWKNQGGTWTPLTDKMPFNPIGALAIDPTNPSIIYAGTGEPHAGLHAYYGVGLYKSTDGGANWQVLGADTFGGRAFSRIVINPSNTQILYASISHPGLGYPGGIVAVKGHPGAMNPGGVFRSSDGGANWSQLAGGLPAVDASDVAMAPDNPNTLYAAIGAALGDPGNGVYKSTDGGDTWTKLGGGFPANTARTVLAVAPSNAQRIYASIAGPGNDTSSTASATIGLYKSDDAGATWANTSAGAYLGNQGNYDNCLVVDRTNPDIVFTGGVNMTTTSNGGTSWTSASAVHSDHQFLAQAINGDFLVGTDGGVNRRAAGSTTWTRVTQGYGVTQLYSGISIHPTNRAFLLGGFQDNGSHLSTAKGMWKSVQGGDGGYTAMHPAAPDVLFCTVYDAGSLYRSLNGGATAFSKASTGITTTDRTAFYQVTVFHPTDPMTVFTATHRVYKSTNQGSNWTPISGDLTSGDPYAIRALAISPTNPQILWASTNEHKVLVSTDGGANFTQKTDAQGWRRVTRELSVPPWDDQTAFVAVSRFGMDQVKMTKNLGTTWTAIDGDLPDIPVNTVDSAWVQSRKAIFIGTDRGAYFSCNEGQHWELMGTTLPNVVVNDIRYDPYFKRVVASTMGRGVWEMDEPSMDSCPLIDGGGGSGGTGGTGGTGPDGGGSAGTAGAGGSGGATGGTAGASGAAGKGGAAGSGGAAGKGGTAGTAGSGGTAGTGGAGATGGAAGASGTGGSAGSSGGAAGSAGAGGRGGSGGAAATGGVAGTPPNPTDDSGCTCNLSNRGTPSAFGLSIAGVLAAFWRRRRRPDDA